MELKKTNKITNNLALEVISKKLKVSINDGDVGKCCRIGRKDQNSADPRVVIIKYSRWNDRRKVFLSKRKLKGLGVSITESLYIPENGTNKHCKAGTWFSECIEN